MAFSTVGPTGTAALVQPASIGSRLWNSGHLLVDNSYVSGTGFVVPATVVGMTITKHATFGLDSTMTNLAVFISAGANITFKVLVLATLTELASAAGSGLSFSFEVWGV